jgi:uncharacterized protein
MDFEWDSAKEQANRKKHGLDFQTATKVFLDPYAIEFDDRGARWPHTVRELHDERRRRPHHFRPRSGTA